MTGLSFPPRSQCHSAAGTNNKIRNFALSACALRVYTGLKGPGINLARMKPPAPGVILAGNLIHDNDQAGSIAAYRK